MPTTIKFDPYAFSHGVELRVIDRYDPGNEHYWEAIAVENAAEQVLNLSARDHAWTQLRVELEATLSEAELVRVLPPTTDPVSDTALLVTVRCPATLARDVVVLEPRESGRWTGEVVLNHSEVRGVVTLQPRLVRRTEIPDPRQVPPGIAHERHAVIGDGRVVKLIVDASEPPITGGLAITWEDFRGSKNDWRANHPSDVHYLDTGGPEPTVWLNSRYTSLKAALHSTATNGPEATLRHLANALIAQSVWFQLFMVSSVAVEVDPEVGTVRKPGGWRGATLDTLLPKLFPEHSEEEDQLEELSTQLSSPEQVGSLVTRLGSAIQESLPTYRRIEDAIAASERLSHSEER